MLQFDIKFSAVCHLLKLIVILA